MGLLICTTPLLFITHIPIILLSLLFVSIDWWAIKTRHLTGIHPNTKSYGTVFYPIAILILVLLLWSNYKIIFVLATLIMVIADAMAALVGNNYATKFYIFYEEQKSIPGSITMFATTGLLLFASIQFFGDNRMLDNLSVAVLIGVVATAAELISKKGSDNLSVPLIAALFLYGFLGEPSETIRFQLTLGIILAALVAAVSYQMCFLKMNGAVVAFLLGSIIFGFGGLKYTVPILLFFVLSSVLSKTGRRKKSELEQSFEKSGVRDMYQVLANGGIPGILMILIFLLQREDWYPIYLVAIAAATADTWATEIGVFSRHKPHLITNFKTTAPGTSGAISILGSLAAVMGSLIILLSGQIFMPESGTFKLVFFLSLVLCGVLGSFIDSIMGATIQAQYKCRSCQKNTEKMIHCQQSSILIRGHVLINNDLVNFLSIAAAVVISFVFINIDFLN